MAAAAAQGVVRDQNDAGFRIGTGTRSAGTILGGNPRAAGAGVGGVGGEEVVSAITAVAMRARRAGGGSSGSTVFRSTSTMAHSSAISAWHSAHVDRWSRTVANSSASTAPRANAPSRSRASECLAMVGFGSTIELHPGATRFAGSGNKQRRLIAAGHGRVEFVVFRSQVVHHACLLMHTGPRTPTDHVHGECHIHCGAAVESNTSGEHNLLPTVAVNSCTVTGMRISFVSATCPDAVMWSVTIIRPAPPSLITLPVASSGSAEGRPLLGQV